MINGGASDEEVEELREKEIAEKALKRGTSFLGRRSKVGDEEVGVRRENERTV